VQLRILIIGSEGFIGKAAVSYFEAKGHEVFCVDVLERPGPRYYKITRTPLSFSDIFDHFTSLDVCINASGAANVQQSFTDTSGDFQLNTYNVLLIAEAIRRLQSACKLINLSSAAVYGNPKQLPICETAIVKPLSPYGWHKLMSEQICREYTEQFNLQTQSLRVFSAYGEGQKKLLFWDVYQKILSSTDNNIELFGTGRETRDFIYISDVMQAVECVISNGNFDGSAINIASGVATTINEAANIFLEEAAPGFRIRYTGDNKHGDPLYWQADIKKLQNLGFTPGISLHQGLKATWKWLKDRH
jgi:dTDP-glucose 4,6-dehydratase/UDP-glucose 4-epimerase